MPSAGPPVGYARTIPSGPPARTSIWMIMMMNTEKLRALLEYDPATGILRWKSRGDPHWDGRWAGKRAGCVRKQDGYRVIHIGCLNYRSARVIWALVRGQWPSRNVDHKNRDRVDDRWSNLRLATDSQNAANQGTRSDNLLGIRGVRRLKKGYAARIMRAGKSVHLGLFETQEAAQHAYAKAASELFGEYASSAS